MKRGLILLSLVLLAAASVTAASYGYLRPVRLKVAIQAADHVDQKLFGLAADGLRTQRAGVRLEVVVKDNAEEVATALEKQQVQLAVLRSDAAMRDGTPTVMVLRTEVAVILAPKNRKIKKISDLPRSALGVVIDGPADGGLLRLVLEYYGIPPTSIRPVFLKPSEIGNALREKKVDAVIVVGLLTSKLLADTIGEVARATSDGVQFIDIEEASAIAKRAPALSHIEIEEGTFGGRTPRPPEKIDTLGYTMRLVAHDRTDEDAVAELARQLINMRQHLSTAVPGAGLMDTPDLDDKSAFLVHPGTRIFVNGDQKTFFDRYSDYIYLGLFLGGGIGSVITGALSWMGIRQRRESLDDILQIEDVLGSIAAAQHADELDMLERKTDEIVDSAVDHGAKGLYSSSEIATFQLAITEARSRIASRRLALLVNTAPAAASEPESAPAPIKVAAHRKKVHRQRSRPSKSG